MTLSADLPIHEVIPALKTALAAHPLVLLQAPPGAGKSTALPLELLREPWLAGQGVLLLQPRRVAARAVASRLAEGLGEDLGGAVGYRVRFESRVSARTRLEVVTEGILTRRLQRDPELGGVGLVILDEFHERSLHADLALALLREVQGALRDDLRVLVMSATLDPTLPARLGAPHLETRGRAYPVEVRYLATDPAGRVGDLVAGAVRRALNEEEGDLLAFLPGVREIRGAQAALAGVDATVLPLYGDLPLREQRRALVPDPQGARKVVLATSIAETSLTIGGVRVVVDSGQSRTGRFDPASGLTRMVTERVTRDSAEQRAGRAGRTAPGVAYRLWPERTQALLSAARPPEILESDLTPLTLELAGWGVSDPADLPWLDPPSAHRIEAARALLRTLGALDGDGRITPEGRRLLDFPTHPRLAHLLTGPSPELAADVAALLEERDPLPPGSGADLVERVAALRAWRAGGAARGEVGVLERVERLSRQWRRLLGVEAGNAAPDPQAVAELVARAYPERLALAREAAPGQPRGRFLLAGGQGAALPEGDALCGAGALAVAHLDAGASTGTGTGGAAEGRIFLAAPLDPTWLAQQAEWQDAVRWDARTGILIAAQERRLGALVLGSRPLREINSEARIRAVADAVRAGGLHLLTFSPEAEAWRARVASLRAWRGEDWPDLSGAALLEGLETWLGPALAGVRTQGDLARLPLLPALQTLLPWPLPAQLGDLAPTHLSVPSGSRVRLSYRAGGEAPILAVKLQELFGLAETPTVNGGRTPVLLHLLSPAGRPVQVTQDLRSFWNSSYFEVRKDLRGRYPKHPWPDDPWTHAPTRFTKRRG